MPTFDVIIPAYNAAKFLPAAIQSVIEQTFIDWRILLIDDGSTDNTPDVVAPYIEELGPKLKYIRKPNGGLPAARNTAIRNSDATYLALLDADDIWLPNRLEESFKTMDGRPDVGLSYGFVSRIDSDGALIDTFSAKQKNGEGRIAPYIYMREVHLPCPTLTFRRSSVDEVGLFDESLQATEDRDMWVRIAFRYDVALVPKVIALYRMSPFAMTNNPERMLNAQLQFIEKHYGSEGCGPVERRIGLSNTYRQRAEAFGIRRQWWSGFKSSLRALTFYPLDIRNARTAVSLLFSCVTLRR
jgi:glycosyltransferase involved in cell wall biosynthesis